MKFTHFISIVGACGVLCLSGSVPAQAEEVSGNTPVIGEVFQQLYCDLNQDGVPETIRLMPFAKDEYDQCFMRLQVFDGKSHKLLWQTPKITDCTNKRFFGATVCGNTDLQVVGDIDGDGRIELVGAMPRSDVSPTRFRVWYWDGDKFIVRDVGVLLAPDHDSDDFFWRTGDSWYDDFNDRWIDRLEMQKGCLTAYISDICAGCDPMHSNGMAQMKPFSKGLRVDSWQKRILRIKY